MVVPRERKDGTQRALFRYSTSCDPLLRLPMNKRAKMITKRMKFSTNHNGQQILLLSPANEKVHTKK